MTTHEQEGFAPLFDPDEEQPQESSDLLIPSGLGRQRTLERQLLKARTGDADVFLSADREQELALKIQEGLMAQEYLATVTEKERKRYPAQVKRFEDAVQTGIEAEQELVECNLRFAGSMALYSMNIVPPKLAKEAGETGKRIGTFGDIRKLRSPYASQEDRVQIARAGLVIAARKFKPKKTKDGKPIRFTTFAAWQIHQELSRKVRYSEEAGATISETKQAELSKARNTANKDEFSPEQLEHLARVHNLTQSVPFDTLELSVTADEEYEDEWHGTPSLAPHEVIADLNEDNDVEGEATRDLLRQNIDKVTQTLSEREAGVIRLRFGLVDGVPRTLDEIGQVYGIGKERVRQIENKTMTKLRHPDRSGLLRDFLDEGPDQTMTQLAQNSHINLPDALFGVANVHAEAYPVDTVKTVFGEDKEVSPFSKIKKSRNSWQLTDDEEWDMPMRRTPEAMHEDDLHTQRLFTSILNYADPKDFQKTDAQSITYPVETLADIRTACGGELKAYHVETYWNDHLETFIEKMKKQKNMKFNLDSVSLLFSALLADTMKDDEEITLTIPEELRGKLNYLGIGLKHGTLTIEGDAGDFAGCYMEDLGQMHVKGSVGHRAGAFANGLSSLTVEGNAGKDFAHGATSTSVFEVKGEITSLSVAPDFAGEIVAGSIRHQTLSHAKARRRVTVRQ